MDSDCDVKCDIMDSDICAGVPNYLEVITDPMDLGTVKKCMASNRYETHEQWADDIRKVWNNAMYFNAAGK